MAANNKVANKLPAISGAGLVFIQESSPFGTIVSAITRQLFNVIGFYYTSSSSITADVYVVLFDIVDGVAMPTWRSYGTKLSEVVANPAVKTVAISQLSPVLDVNKNVDVTATAAREQQFRMEIFKVTTNITSGSIENYIYNLFGFPQPDSAVSKGLFGVEMVNIVINNMGLSSLIPANWTILDIISPDRVYATSDGALTSLHRQYNIYLQQTAGDTLINKPLQSYTATNPIFNALVYLDRPTTASDLSAQEGAMTLLLAKQRLAIESLTTTFVDLMFSNQEFFNVAAAGMNAILMKSDIFNVAVNNGLEQMNLKSLDIIQLLIQAVNTKTIDYIQLTAMIQDLGITMLANNTLYIGRHVVPPVMPILPVETNILFTVSSAIMLAAKKSDAVPLHIAYKSTDNKAVKAAPPAPVKVNIKALTAPKETVKTANIKLRETGNDFTSYTKPELLHIQRILSESARNMNATVFYHINTELLQEIIKRP